MRRKLEYRQMKSSLLRAKNEELSEERVGIHYEKIEGFFSIYYYYFYYNFMNICIWNLKGYSLFSKIWTRDELARQLIYQVELSAMKRAQLLPPAVFFFVFQKIHCFARMIIQTAHIMTRFVMHLVSSQNHLSNIHSWIGIPHLQLCTKLVLTKAIQVSVDVTMHHFKAIFLHFQQCNLRFN